MLRNRKAETKISSAESADERNEYPPVVVRRCLKNEEKQ
jgi:hypothetical protein